MPNKKQLTYLLKPLNSTPEIREAMESFQNSWKAFYDSDKSLTLYHYTTFEGLKGILDSRSLWCSHVSALNDPLELLYGKRIILDNINSFLEKENDKKIKTILDNLIILIEAFDKNLYSTYVASFCEEDNLLSQWRGYSGKGIGYNIGILFDSETRYSHDIQNLEDSSVSLLKIIYEPNDQNNFVSKYLSSIIASAQRAIKRWEIAEGTTPISWESQVAAEAVNLLFEIMLSMKSPVFKEEKEWRLIKVLMDDYKPELLSFRENEDIPIPYITTFIYKEINRELEFPIESIRFGPMLEEGRAKKSLKLFVIKRAIQPYAIKINHKKIRIDGSGYILR